MSSAAYNRLHGLFKNSTATATATGTATGTAVSTTKKIIKEKTKRPKKSPASSTSTTAAAGGTVVSRSKTENLSFEPLPMSQLTTSLANLKMFIDTFKRTSNTGPFRYSYKYYDDAVSHLARAKQHAYIEEILEHQKRYKTDMTKEAFVVRLISLYGKSRMFDHARKLFDEMPELNCPRTVLSANVSQLVSIRKDWIRFKAFCEIDAIDSALQMADEMEKNGFECNVYTYNTILDALYGKGNILDADKIWDVMKSKNLDPDVRTYNAKLRGLIVANRIT
ncbi:pentatricopeptide repeat-containing protein At3g13150-like [Cynara cardunculus var. scolymus]|uniref:pentatricopeptide repeat-containing protein At3g13150-like n=1 Tax=Cynara cardunculus var. scolymus TaxID=59895 RepID=UPI000D624A1A|nr:pentatricopeptide repeat-containing protein At3g13150-like [Cynara cardunculus var. scolymus]